MFECSGWCLSVSFSHYSIQVGCRCSLTASTSCTSVSLYVIRKVHNGLPIRVFFPVEPNADISGVLECIWKKGILHLLL